MNIKVENEARLDYLKFLLDDIKDKLRYYEKRQEILDKKYDYDLEITEKKYKKTKAACNFLSIILLLLTYNITILIPIIYNILMHLRLKNNYDLLKNRCNEEYIIENNSNCNKIMKLKNKKNNLEEQVRLRNFLNDVLNYNSLELIDEAIYALEKNTKTLEIEELTYLRDYIVNEKNYVERQNKKIKKVIV